jgi:HEAT repeat protein
LFTLLALGSFTLVQAALGATPEESVTELIPRLAAPNVPDRYSAQMELQMLASTSSKPGSEAARAELGKVLAAKAADAATPQPARVWITRQLEYMGGAEAVAALNQMLDDKDAEVRECARRALEKNPAPAATASLRAALQKGGEASWKIGLINSLGQKQDMDSTGLIAGMLNDPQMIVAAALALGKISTPSAVDALWMHVEKNPAVADALINAANRMSVASKASPARSIYLKIYQQQSLAVSARAGALTGLAKADPAGAAPLISQALTSKETTLQNAAVIAAPFALGKNCSTTLAGQMSKLTPRAKALVLNILDASAEKAVVFALDDMDASVRLAAVDALGRMGGAASVSPLLTLATTDGKPEKAAADAALSKMNGEGAGAAIEQAAGAGDAKLRAAALSAIAARKQLTAMPVLFKCAEDANAPIRKAAYSALGKLAEDKDMTALAKLALKDSSGQASAALEAAAQRAQDKAAVAKSLLAVATDEASQAATMDALSAVGGSDALAVVTKLTKSADANTRESAIKALGNWADFTAAKPLLALAADATLKDNLYAQTMQAIVRLVKSSENEPADSRADVALAAMAAARKDNDKKLVLSALGTVPNMKAVEAIKPLLADATFKADAGQAGISLAEILVRINKQAGKELAQAVKDAAISDDITKRANRVLSR